MGGGEGVRYLYIKAFEVHEVQILVRLAAGELEVLRLLFNRKRERGLAAAVVYATPYFCFLPLEGPCVGYGQPLVAEGSSLLTEGAWAASTQIVVHTTGIMAEPALACHPLPWHAQTHRSHYARK